jgi:hypothetical protein
MNETWVPRCPKCAQSHLVLAPANQHTRNIVEKVEVYCTECQWRGFLVEFIHRIYVRI